MSFKELEGPSKQPHVCQHKNLSLDPKELEGS